MAPLTDSRDRHVPLFVYPLAAAFVVVASLVRAGWSRAPARRVALAVHCTLAVVAALAAGTLVDPLARGRLLDQAAALLEPWAAPFGDWFHGARLPRDLLGTALVAGVLLHDACDAPLFRPRRLRGAAARAGARLASFAREWWPVAALVWGWLDSLATTGGPRGLALLQRAQRAPLPLPHAVSAEYDPHFPAFVWWLVASVLGGLLWRAVKASPGLWASGHVSLIAAESPRVWPRWPRWLAWWLVPLAGGALALAWRPAAVVLAIPTFLAVAALLALFTWHAYRHRTEQPAAAAAALALLESAAVAGLLALALALRWWGFGHDIAPGTDAFGYASEAMEFPRRVRSAGSNPVAVFYLRMHVSGREPLFPLLLRWVFDVTGDSLLVAQYVSIFAAVAAMGIGYLFARATLGRIAALGALILICLQPWHVFFSHAGLREDAAAGFVYGLALLLVRGGRSVPAAALAGTLAAAAVMVRLDAAFVVALLLLLWGLTRHAHLRSWLPAYAVAAALVTPMLVGFFLQYGDPVAPIRSNLGGDMNAQVAPLRSGSAALADALPNVVPELVRGIWYVYSDVLFGVPTAYLPGVAGTAAVWLLTVAFAAGWVWLLVRGPRLPAVLAVLGVFLPPFVFVMRVYADHLDRQRYVYLVMPAAFAVASWMLARTATLALALLAPARQRHRQRHDATARAGFAPRPDPLGAAR